MDRHFPIKRIGRLFAVLLAFAMLFAPLSTRASAEALVGHEQAMSEEGNCKMAGESAAAHHGVGSKACCQSTNMAVPASLTGAQEREVLRPVPHAITRVAAPVGIAQEIATPPPRRS